MAAFPEEWKRVVWSALQQEESLMESLEYEVGTRWLKSRQELCEDALHHWKERQEVIEQVSPVLLVANLEKTLLLAPSHWAHLLQDTLVVYSK
jgi:hypothetical protein